MPAGYCGEVLKCPDARDPDEGHMGSVEEIGYNRPMKWVYLAIAIFLAVAVIVLYPTVQKEKVCFDNAQSTINDIQYNIVARGFGPEEVCSRRSVALMDLDDCIHAATGSSKLAKYKTVNNIIEDAVYFIRPLTKSLTTLKTEHNEDCVNFSTYQLD